MIIEKILRELKRNNLHNKIHIDGNSLKIQNEVADIGEIEIGIDEKLMIVKIKMFFIENNPETALEIGEIRTLRNFYDGKIYSIIMFY